MIRLDGPHLLRSGLFGLTLASAGIQGCNQGDDCKVDTSYDPVIDPGAFVPGVNHPLFPLSPGAALTYVEGQDTILVSVLPEPKIILGVTCTVVHDVDYLHGDAIEDTYDWFAQDTTGAVWYMGEDTRELSHGRVVSTEGSWEAGVDGAKPGVLIPAVPTVGQIYRQEYYACSAEDMGSVLNLDASASVPAGDYSGCLETRDFTPLEPDVNEHKYYAPRVGLVLTVDVKGGGREELISVWYPDGVVPR